MLSKFFETARYLYIKNNKNLPTDINCNSFDFYKDSEFVHLYIYLI